MDHYGMIQWWRYPDDGAGACHSYALLKRRMLMQAGWPRTALLMTIVHEADGEGHAVLTVRTDKGELVLDNLNERILLWSETPYSYYKRQSQADPNVWVMLDDPRTTAAKFSAR
jgi:predicted transglutaminase-like cysteine proteinase